jgi:hypothetical protein
MKEVWKDVIGYEEYDGLYKISNHGRVKNVKTGKFINRSNKSHIELKNKGNRKSVSVKELLYIAFSENPELIKKDIKFNYWHKNKLIEPTYEYESAGKHKRIPVICVTTGKKFDYINEANDFYNIKAGAIMRCCKGIRKSAGRLEDGTPLIWSYINKNN